jgi:pyrimidine and pyridine-specific 5'-nucleotidase
MAEYVVFFDVDNCLYSASTAISHLMMKRIRGEPHNFTLPQCYAYTDDSLIEYFISMGYSEQDAEKLHSQ